MLNSHFEFFPKKRKMLKFDSESSEKREKRSSSRDLDFFRRGEKLQHIKEPYCCGLTSLSTKNVQFVAFPMKICKT
jgi:hypothetical protein